jgi:hypothetical protein
MELPHELTHDKAASFALSWSITWRVILIAVVVTSLLYFIPLDTRIENPTLFLIINILGMFVLIWAWIHRILRLGIGRVKIIFMEEKHYDALVTKANIESEL